MREDAFERGEGQGPERPDAPPPDDSRSPSRRSVLRTAATAAVGAIFPSAIDLNAARTMAREAGPMTFEGVVAEAQRLAAAPYAAPVDDLPPALAALSYDGYRRIVFRPAEALRLGRNFSAQLFHRGFLQKKRVRLFVQPRGGPPWTVPYDQRLFDLGEDLAGQSFAPDLGFAGFRLHYAFTDAPKDRPPGFQEEFLVFLGASYFRLRGDGQEYGLSARGLAIATGAPEGEEFPDFVAHWICEPAPEARTLTVLSLLDSPGVAGAYRFEIAPGDPSRMTVTASLHPRRRLDKVGLAPLTSMFLHGESGPGARNAQPFDDFRPEVHDSDGLVVATDADRLWRPLVNGRPAPQISAFRTAPLRGFGLMQRERNFAAYLDVEARHEARPGHWIEPVEAQARPEMIATGASPRPGAFADGAVQLFEIPSREEYMDNIVAAFVPATPLEAGKPLRLAYRLTTVGAEPAEALPGDLARVVSTRVGSAERLRPAVPPSPQRRLYAIDFEGPNLPKDHDALVRAVVSASAGEMVEPVAAPVPQTGGWRIYVEWRPPAPMPAGDVILRAHLERDGRRISETWDAPA